MIKFTSDLSLGVPLLDRQHKEYIKRLDAFLKKYEENAEGTVLDEYLSFLQDYAVEHFDSEEFFMQGKEYPWLEQHKTFHKYFVEHLEGFAAHIREAGYTPDIMEDLRQLLVDWFFNHIKQQDRKVADFIKFQSEEQ